MKNFCIALLAVAAITSCTKENPGEDPYTSRDIKISSAIEASSKSVVENDAVLSGIVFLRKDGAEANFAGVSPSITAERATTGAITLSPNQQYPTNNDAVHFVGYYPAGTAAAGTATWTIDGKTDILLSDSWNAGSYTSPETTGLTFKHQLAQLEIIVEATPASDLTAIEAAWGNITKIELIGTNTTATYTYATNAVTYSTPADKALVGIHYTADFTPVALTATATPVAAGMFAPETTTNPLSLKIYTTTKTSGVPVSVQLKDGETPKGFEKSKKHTVTLQFRATAKDIQVTNSTIQGFDPGYVETVPVE